MTHSHAPFQVDAPKRRTLNIAAAVVAMATVTAMFVLWPSSDFNSGLGELGFGSEFYDARVLDVGEAPCAGTTEADDIMCRLVSLRLLQGPDEGDVTELNFADDNTTSPDFDIGDKVVLSRHADAEAGFEYAFSDRNRKPVLFWLAVVFAIAVVALGRLRGLAALGGLAVSFVVLLRFVLPAILDGQNPLVVAIVGSAAIAFLAIYVAHGFGPLTTVALLGTLGALVATVAAAEVFVNLADFSGFGTEEAIYLNVAQRGSINLNGLLLGGIVIGALGAIDDMTVTQAAVVSEIRQADPHMSRVRLFAASMRVGRDHVASTVNTLALAYAGAAMPLLILFILARQSLGTVANGEVVATEIIRTLVGGLGLVVAVPLTTWLAVWAASTEGPPKAAAVVRRTHRESVNNPFDEDQ